MILSKDKTDKRLLDLVRVQKAHRLGIKIGFDGLSLNDYEIEKLEDSIYDKPRAIDNEK